MQTSKKAGTGSGLPPDTRSHHNSFVRAAGSFVPKLTAKVFERYGFHSAEIMASWPTIIGADLARVTQPERIKWPRGTEVDGESTRAGAATLVLRADPAQALDVEYRAREIIDRINRYFGYRAVSQIKIVQVPLVRPSAQAPPVNLPATSPAPPPPMNEVADANLHAALTALWASIHAGEQRR